MEAKLFEIGILEIDDIQYLDADMLCEIASFFKPAQRRKFLSIVSQAQHSTPPILNFPETTVLASMSIMTSPIPPASPASSKTKPPHGGRNIS